MVLCYGYAWIRAGESWVSPPPLCDALTILRRLTAEEGASFGKVIDGDLRVVKLGSWLHPTKADYYLQRLPVLLRQRKTAKVQGIVQRARDALFGGPVAMMDEGFDDDEDRVQRIGDLLANVIM